MTHFLQSATLAEVAHGQQGLVLDLLAILAAAGLVALLLRRYQMATIPGYLIVGALIGPHALGLAGGESQSLGSLATILLMFIIGLHLDLSHMKAGMVSTAIVSSLATGLCVLVGWPIALAFGLPAPVALAVSMAVSISSTAVVLRLMEQRRDLHKAHGRLTFGVLVFQDMLALGMMALIPVLAVWTHSRGGGPDDTVLDHPWTILRSASIAIAGILVMIFVGRWALPRLLRAAAGSGEAMLVLSAGIALGAAVATSALGFSPELGAFLAGFLLASTPFRYQLAGQLTPLRDLFLAIFFTALGLDLPVGEVIDSWWIVLLAAGATIVVKTLAMFVAAWAGGASAPVAAFVALATAQGSEFSLVLIAQARAAHMLEGDEFGLCIAVVVITLVATPLLVYGGRRLSPRFRKTPHAPWIRKPVFAEPTPPADGADAGSVDQGPAKLTGIVAGFGPVGRAVADALEKRGIRITVVELNPRTVERQQVLGRTIIYGDAGNLGVLESAGLAEASFVVLTMPDEEAVMRACRLVRSVRRDVFIAARVNALSRGIQAMQLGADHAVVEELATAEAMAAQVLTKLEQVRQGEDTGPKLYELGA